MNKKEVMKKKTWKEYFSNAQIYGLDIDSGCKKHEEDRVNIVIGSQIDENFRPIKAEIG